MRRFMIECYLRELRKASRSAASRAVRLWTRPSAMNGAGRFDCFTMFDFSTVTVCPVAVFTERTSVVSFTEADLHHGAVLHLDTHRRVALGDGLARLQQAFQDLLPLQPRADLRQVRPEVPPVAADEVARVAHRELALHRKHRRPALRITQQGQELRSIRVRADRGLAQFLRLEALEQVAHRRQRAFPKRGRSGYSWLSS